MSSPSGSKTVNLVVDMQYDERLSIDQLEARMKTLRESADQLRKQGIPTVWIALGDVNKLHEPASASESIRQPADLARAGFFGHGPGADEEHLAQFREIMKKYGPREDEAVFTKAFFGSFTEKKDLERMRQHLLDQRDGLTDTDLAKALSGDALHGYLQKLGAQRVTVMGGNADVCVMETAMGAATNGLRATIVSDRVVSRGEESFSNPAYQEKIVRSKLGKITDNPAALKEDPTHKAFAQGLLTTTERNMIRTHVNIQPFAAIAPNTPDTRSIFVSAPSKEKAPRGKNNLKSHRPH